MRNTTILSSSLLVVVITTVFIPYSSKYTYCSNNFAIQSTTTIITISTTTVVSAYRSIIQQQVLLPTTTVQQQQQKQFHWNQHFIVTKRKLPREIITLMTTTTTTATTNTKMDDDDTNEIQQQQPIATTTTTTTSNKLRKKLMSSSVASTILPIKTIRNFSNTIPVLNNSNSNNASNTKENAINNIQLYTQELQNRHVQQIPFTQEYEISMILHSLQNIIPKYSDEDKTMTITTSDDTKEKKTEGVKETNDHNTSSLMRQQQQQQQQMENMLEQLQNHILPQYGHLSHKNWTITNENANIWYPYLFPNKPSLSLSCDSKTNRTIKQEANEEEEENQNDEMKILLPQQYMFERIYREGNWDGAIHHHHQQHILQQEQQANPWVVLVTGVNGIRKTTSIYQEWFPKLLQEAIQSPSDVFDDGDITSITNLPSGSNSFFRQLDHMIATLCNEEFIRLYTYSRDMLVSPSVTTSETTPITESSIEEPTSDIIQYYSNMKAAIFTRYRTISELLGVILLREAQSIPINCMVETSGRDVAMFHYIDHFFTKHATSARAYKKLALHFTINDLEYAKRSVDQRMIHEIKSGIMALQKDNILEIINTNIGGPYGSEVLSDIQADSDRVWKESVMAENGGVGQDWYKATIQINAHPTEPWTAQAVKSDGTLGTIYEFVKK